MGKLKLLMGGEKSGVNLCPKGRTPNPPLPPPKIPLHVTVRTRKTAPVKGRLAGAGLIGRDVPQTI